MSFIETKNLDGETNLKHKQGHKELVEYLQGNHERINRRESKVTMTEENSQYDIDKVLDKEKALDRETLAKMSGAFV
jgi:magnesium-transporting ATPase (P-type)